MSEYLELMEKLQEKPEPPWEEIGKVEEKAWTMLKSLSPKEYSILIDKLEDLCYAIELPEAEMIVKAMRPKGQMWTYAQIEDYVEQKGVEDDYVNWYLVMNMVFNDYYNTARKYNLQNDTEFYYCLAKDFITDPDGSRHKVEKYFKG